MLTLSLVLDFLIESMLETSMNSEGPMTTCHPYFSLKVHFYVGDRRELVSNFSIQEVGVQALRFQSV